MHEPREMGHHGKDERGRVRYVWKEFRLMHGRMGSVFGADLEHWKTILGLICRKELDRIQFTGFEWHFQRSQRTGVDSGECLDRRLHTRAR